MWDREEAECKIGRRLGLGYRCGRVQNREEAGCCIGRMLV